MPTRAQMPSFPARKPGAGFRSRVVRVLSLLEEVERLKAEVENALGWESVSAPGQGGRPFATAGNRGAVARPIVLAHEREQQPSPINRVGPVRFNVSCGGLPPRRPFVRALVVAQ